MSLEIEALYAAALRLAALCLGGGTGDGESATSVRAKTGVAKDSRLLDSSSSVVSRCTRGLAPDDSGSL